MIFLSWFLIYDDWFTVFTCENHLVYRALSDDAIMMVGLRLIIMNTTCFVAFLVWFLNRNSKCVPLNETQQWVWNGMDCLSRCSAFHWTEPTRVIESSKILMFIFVLIFLLTALAVCWLERFLNATCWLSPLTSCTSGSEDHNNTFNVVNLRFNFYKL